MGPRHWTRDSILQEIRDLWEAGESLSTRNMSSLGYGGLVTAAYRPELFGSWRAAVMEAGLDPKEALGRRRKWTRERILGRIRELHAAGHDLSYGAAKHREQYLVVVAGLPRFFGSWRAAVEAAGLDYGRVRRRERWTREKIVERLRLLAPEGDRLSMAAARREHGALVAAAVSPRYFGGWRAALRAAGIECPAARRRSRKRED